MCKGGESVGLIEKKKRKEIYLSDASSSTGTPCELKSTNKRKSNEACPVLFVKNFP